jgi:hypothetical protein
VKAHEIGPEHAFEELIAPGQGAKSLGRRERDVQKEANSSFWDQLTQQLRHEHELIVMHPDNVAFAIVFGSYLGKFLINVLVSLPAFDHERKLLDQAVKRGPDRAVGKVLVIAFELAAREVDGTHAQLRQAPAQLYS